jgi:activator of HSP90 ATPase
MSKSIRQKITFNASPIAVYTALMDSKQHAAFTEDRASISKQVGGKFSAHGGFLTGINVELVIGKRIVQAWRYKEWPQGAYSIIRFDLTPSRTGGTVLNFTQDGVPDSWCDQHKVGWRDYYWEPLKEWFAKPIKSKTKK